MGTQKKRENMLQDWNYNLSKKETNEVGYQTMIYFDPERLEEIKFFIKNK